ncbi:hypothetical protein AB1L07_02675 [Niallia alba]|uniref:hypothetical protein n=1 Tax=Niallia alba TaxID=2729105 RepID=UPI0039A254DB
MSVDFYQCDCCEESRYEEYVDSCSKCGHRLCTYCLENDDIHSNYAHHYNVKFDGSVKQKEEFGVESKENSKYGYEVGEIIDDSGIDSKYCPYCNKTHVSKEDVFNYLLSKLNINYEDLEREYLESN